MDIPWSEWVSEGVSVIEWGWSLSELIQVGPMQSIQRKDFWLEPIRMYSIAQGRLLWRRGAFTVCYRKPPKTWSQLKTAPGSVGQDPKWFLDRSNAKQECMKFYKFKQDF
jgi:hypothetical protein